MAGDIIFKQGTTSGFFAYILFLLTGPSVAWASTFTDHFEDAAIRVEFFQSGNASKMDLVLKRMVLERTWPENPNRLVMPFEYGKYRIRILSVDGKQTLFSKGFDPLFAEYVTTQKAIDGAIGEFEMATRFPKPKHSVQIVIEQRQKDNSWTRVWQQEFLPDRASISTDAVSSVEVLPILNQGRPAQQVDLVFVAEGYRASEKEKFVKDIERMVSKLFSANPYSKKRERFNVHGVFVASNESGTDVPHRGLFRDTALNASFNTLDIQRYLLVQAQHRLHEIASAAPYDNIVVLVNASEYGGGGMGLDYCVTTSDHALSPFVFIHELGHGFAYLADEYIGNVTYNDMYPIDVEPVEPNLTRELDRSKIKWGRFLTPDIPLPTESKELSDRVVGAFEGGGYLSKGIFRAEAKCWMGTGESKHGFCVACEDGIRKMIDFYTVDDHE